MHDGYSSQGYARVKRETKVCQKKTKNKKKNKKIKKECFQKRFPHTRERDWSNKQIESKKQKLGVKKKERERGTTYSKDGFVPLNAVGLYFLEANGLEFLFA